MPYRYSKQQQQQLRGSLDILVFLLSKLIPFTPSSTHATWISTSELSKEVQRPFELSLELLLGCFELSDRHLIYCRYMAGLCTYRIYFRWYPGMTVLDLISNFHFEIQIQNIKFEFEFEI
uniref:Uncharacterized protein n=1 Tax=Ananas comosus var. bracteatus TaxID=296719 RepID=A0A6V7QBU3_ANACO|nr:unnamed protein product [Ananas comosus var. bracteatus]